MLGDYRAIRALHGPSSDRCYTSAPSAGDTGPGNKTMVTMVTRNITVAMATCNKITVTMVTCNIITVTMVTCNKN